MFEQQEPAIIPKTVFMEGVLSVPISLMAEEGNGWKKMQFYSIEKSHGTLKNMG